MLTSPLLVVVFSVFSFLTSPEGAKPIGLQNNVRRRSQIGMYMLTYVRTYVCTSLSTVWWEIFAGQNFRAFRGWPNICELGVLAVLLRDSGQHP